MTRSKNTHAILLEYLVLISALLIFGVFIFLYQKDQVYRDAMVVLLGSFYVAWGVAHQFKRFSDSGRPLHLPR